MLRTKWRIFTPIKVVQHNREAITEFAPYSFSVGEKNIGQTVSLSSLTRGDAKSRNEVL